MLRKSTERKFIRSVISRVHPDLFEGHKEEQRVNTESLKELHKAVERLTEGHSADSVELKFYYREKDVSNGTFQFASVRLTDSLVPLYEVFGVISQEEAAELRSNEGHDARNLDDTNFLQWLEATIQEASLTARDLANRKEILNRLQSSITNEFGLKKIRVGSQQGQSLLSVSDVLEQIDSLKIVQESLRTDPECTERLKGLSMRVHCPRNAPVRDYHWVDYASGQDHHISTRRWAEISSLGEVEVVAHTTGVAERLRSLDLTRARQLSTVENFWKARQDMLAKSVAEGLHVKFVWPDENCSSREFCLWAGRVLQDKVIQHELAECQFNFNLLVHSDDQAPSASFLPSSSTVQVHHHCSPRQLLELLVSNAAIAASNKSGRRIETATAEGELLQLAREALGARHVVRICGRDKGDRVSAALQRLVDNASTIRNAVNLSDVCLAIDDNFHLWDSGYVSIPYDFDVKTVVKEVTRLLAPVTNPASVSPSHQAPSASKHTASVEAAPTEPTQQAAADAAEEAAKQAQQAEELNKSTPNLDPEPVHAAGDAGTDYESSDEDVARVYALHSSAAEFIKSLRETDSESIGESIEDNAEPEPWPAPSPNASSPDLGGPDSASTATPVTFSTSQGKLASHPIMPSPDKSSSGKLTVDVPSRPVHVPMAMPMQTVAHDGEPLRVAGVGNGGGEESLRAWLEGQSDCDMAGSALIASPGASAELFGAAAYSGAGATRVAASAAVASAPAGASVVIGPSVPVGGDGGGSSGSGGSTGGSVRGRSAASGGGGGRRRKSNSGRFAAVAGTLTALPEPTLPPLQAQWDMTPYGQVGSPVQPPVYAEPAHPGSDSQDPSERAAAAHAQQQMQQESACTEDNAEVAKAADSSSDVECRTDHGGAAVLHKTAASSDGGSASAGDAASRAQEAEESQDFHTHVNDLLKAVRLVKQRNSPAKSAGGGGDAGTAAAAPAASPGEAATVVEKPLRTRIRRGNTAAAEAAAEAAALLLSSGAANGSAGGFTGSAAPPRRGRTHERASSQVRVMSMPKELATPRPTYKATRHVFSPAEVAHRSPHPTSFPRRDTHTTPTPTTQNGKHAAADRLKKLFSARSRDSRRVFNGLNRRAPGGGGPAAPVRPLQHLQRPTPAQPFHPASSNASKPFATTPALRRSRSVSRASSVATRNHSVEPAQPPISDPSSFAKFRQDSFAFFDAMHSPRQQTSPPRAATGDSEFSLQPPCASGLGFSPAAVTAALWRSASVQPPQRCDQVSEVLMAREKRMSCNAGVQGVRDASCSRAGRAPRSLTPPPIRGTTEASAAAAARAGANCRSVSRSGRAGAAMLQPLEGAVGPAAAAYSGGLWPHSSTGRGMRLASPQPASQAARMHGHYRSCSAALGRTAASALR